MVTMEAGFKQFKQIITYIYQGGVIILPLVVLLLPANFFDSGKSMCLSVVLFDQTCYGCGMTRALMHLIHLDWNAASNFNKLSFLVLPLLTMVWVQEVMNIIKQYRSPRKNH